ncbi:MAG: hypothetical protein ACHP7D_04425 [Lysobacterales bacterium]
MNSQIDPIRRRKTQVIAAFFGLNLIIGIVLVMQYPGLVTPETAQAAVDEFRGSLLSSVYELTMLIACFGWLSLDSRQLEIRRPWWLNVGVVLLPFAFVPYYLYKTRQPSRRAPAILGFVGIAFGAIVAMMIGMFLALALHTDSIQPSTGL